MLLRCHRGKWLTEGAVPPWLWVLWAEGLALAALHVLWWERFTTASRLVALATLVLPLHVLEEWVWPAGFHYQYNVCQGSARPDRYPMNRLSDAVTNVVGVAEGAALSVWGGGAAAVALLGLCALEVCVHTALGAAMRRRLRPRGKRSLYGPGSATAYGGFLPAGVLLGAWALGSSGASGASLGPAQWALGLALLAAMLASAILLPERLLRSPASPFPFPSPGYYARYLPPGSHAAP
eukprot:m51a1_g11193 hypothetical protein (237) ;mRNA; r:39997-41059